MEFRIGCHIIDKNGTRLGKLTHVVVDPATKEVAEIVLGESGILGRDAIVPVGAVTSAEHDAIHLELTKDQIGNLKDFVLSHFVEPEGYDPGSAAWGSGALIAQGVGPVGAASGMEGLAYTPIVESEEQIPEGDVDIRPGTEVWASDGKIGHVDDVLVDGETKRVRAFLVKEGFVFHHDVEVDLKYVSAIGADRITLSVTKDDLEQDAELK